MDEQLPARFIVYDSMTGEHTAHQLAESTGLTMSRVYHALADLQSFGMIHKVGEAPTTHPCDKPRSLWARKPSNS